jgi:nucleoside-diphosphate-sugar epimerase
MRVVVTGATGNVGTALLRALATEDAVTSIVGLARRQPELRAPKTEFRAVDVSADPLEQHLEGADCVVHLAWLIQPSRDRATTWRTNVQGSRRVFEAAAAVGVPTIVHASSVGAYSRGPKDRLVDESWPTDGIPTSFYSRDKSVVERMLDDLERLHPRVRIVRLRPSLIFQRAMGRELTKLFLGPLVPRRLADPARIPFVPDVAGLRFQVTHSDDVADAYRRAIVGGAHGAFNIAAEAVLDPDALAELLGARKVRLPVGLVRGVVAVTWRARLQPTPEGWVDMGLQTPLLDTRRARDELGWEPTRHAGETLLELVAGFRDGAGAPTPPLR